MQMRSFRVRFTPGQLRRRNAHVARRQEAGHYDRRAFVLTTARPKLRRYSLSFKALRVRLFSRELRAERKHQRLIEQAHALLDARGK